MPTGSGSLKLWYRVDNGVSPVTSGSSVDSWTNSAGISVLDITGTGANRPIVAAGPNNYNEISFNGSNNLVTAIGAITTSNFVTNQASTFVVCQADNTTQTSCVYATDPLWNVDSPGAANDGTRFSNHIPWSGTVYFDIGTCCADRIQVGGLSGLTNYNIWSYDAINTGAGKQLYQNGTQVYTDGVAALTYNDHASHRFNIGGMTSNGEAAGFQGDVTEVIIFNAKLNSLQRIIIQNYLSAKYDITLSANDLYTMDNSGNGNYDHDVAGIGNDGTNVQNNSEGTGVIRIFDPTSMGSGEYYFWGHNNGALQSQTTDVPAGVQGRLTRVWRGQEIGTIDNVDVDFDLNGLGSVTASDLRLLVDTNNDGNFATGVTVVTGGATSVGGGIYRFPNVTDILAGNNSTRRFTLGTINIVQTPLPITLLSFDATVDGSKDVGLTWQTAQEINNQSFTIERSKTGFAWDEVKTVPGAGNSKVTISYSETDENPFWGPSYYRLKQTDFDGTTSYSNVLSVVVKKTFQDIIPYPVPASNELLVEYPSSERIILKLRDELGRDMEIIPVESKKRGNSADFNITSGYLFSIYFKRQRIRYQKNRN